MGKNLVSKTFDTNDNWTCPAGVNRVRAITSTVNLQKISGGNIASASGFTVAIADNGNAYAWGDNLLGQLGDGTNVSKSSPVLVLGGNIFRSVVAGARGAVGLTPGGVLYAWGGNLSGQLGDGTVVGKSSPVLVLGGFKFKEVSAASNAFFGISESGDLYAWGDNTSGSLGVGDVVSRSSPVLVLGGKKWKAVAGVGTSAFAIDSSGDLYAWGGNSAGILGVGDTTPRSSPVLVLGGLKWVQVSGGGQGGSPLGVTGSGDVYAWGFNHNGQLGVGDTTSRSSPVLVLGGLKWVQVSSGQGATSNVHSVGLTTDGDLYAWGGNAAGSLGVGDITPRSSPVLVVGGKKWLSVSAGGVGVRAIDNFGFAYGWGSNANGQIGDNTVVSRSSPALVVGVNMYQSIEETVVNDLSFNVVPGTTYPIVVLSSVPTAFLQPLANGVFSRTKVTLEYYA